MDGKKFGLIQIDWLSVLCFAHVEPKFRIYLLANKPDAVHIGVTTANGVVGKLEPFVMFAYLFLAF